MQSNTSRRSQLINDAKQTGWAEVHYFDLAVGKDKCRALVKMVVKLLVAQNAGNFLTS
jgi:hypothetical protein